MKKTLLCFLFLFTTIFYAQVTSITTCGSQSFDLTSTKADFIGNFNPAETSVTYFLSEDDAINNTNEIANPTKFYGAIGPSKIYGRIDNNGTIYTNYFNLTVFEPLTLTASHKPILCKGDTASLSIVGSGGNGSYQYSLNGSAFTTTNYYSNLPAGVYTIKVKSQNPICPDTSINYTITEPTPIIATNAVVNQNTLIVTATGGTSPYRYSLDGINYQSSNVFPNKAPGNYDIMVSDSEGCGTVVRATILPFLSTAAYIVKELDCIGNGTAIVNVNATGGQAPYTYSIDGFSYQASNIFNIPNAGTYSITVKDALNLISNPFAITVAPLVSVSGVALVTNATSCSNASIIVQTTSGQAPFYYSIDNGQTFTSNNTFNNLTPGNYTFLIKDSKGCFSSPLFNTVQPFVPLTATASSVPLSCSTGKTSLTIAATGGQSPYQYALNNGAYVSNNTYSNLGPGTYNIKVKEDNGCITTLQYDIVSPYPVYADFIVEGQNLTINGQSGTAPYQYSLNSMPYQSNNVYTNLSPGNYTVFIKDAKGCESNAFMILIEEPNALKVSAVLTKELDCNSNATIEITASGGQAPYKYSINGGQTYQSSPVFSNVISGSYNPSVKDAVDMITYANTLIITPPIAVTATITKGTTCGESDLTTITATGGKAPYTYSVDGLTFSAANTISGLSAGIHNIVVKDSNNCQTTVAVTIEPSSALMASITKTDAHCYKDNSGSVTIIANGGKTPYSYSIDNKAFVSTNVFANLVAGQYMLTVKDAIGCTNSFAMSISEPNILLFTSATTSSTTLADNDGKITVTATGGVGPYTYSLTANGNVPTNIFQSSPIFAGLKSGLYDIQVRDAMGCIYMQTSINVSNKTNTLLATADATSATCVNPVGIITVTATGGTLPYQYSSDGGITFVSSNVITKQPGIYTILVRDADNNTTSVNVTVASASFPVVSANVLSNALCKGFNNGSIAAVASGGQTPYTYSINGEAYTATNTFSNLRAGVFTITVKDANNCLSNTTVQLTEPAEDLSATAIAINDQGIIVNAKGGTAPYLYYLQNSNGIVVAGPQDNGIFHRLPLGRYSAQVTDANGCGYIHWSVDVVPSPPLSATASVLPVTCTNAGTITVDATGGFQPYYYSYDNGVTYTILETYSSFKPGSYNIKVRDYKDTIISLTAVIPQENIPVIQLKNSTNIKCKGSADGTITVEGTGGQAPYTFSLNNGPSTSDNGNNTITYTNLFAGIHTIKMTDAKGCIVTISVPITEPETLLTAVTVQNQTVTINASGGSGGYNYAISPNLDKFSSNNVFSQLAPATYTVITSDVNGCFVLMDVVVDPPAPLIEGKNNVTIEFKPGQTLADLIIDGQNIKWYINMNPLEGKTSKSNETPLPLTTVLVDGTTYYASQTINGIESKDRLAVTAKSNGTLGNADFVLPNFKFYPNPVLHNLVIENTAVIDKIEIISVSGQTVLSKAINDLHSEIDLSNVSSGVYLLKVKSDGQEKTIKILKK